MTRNSSIGWFAIAGLLVLVIVLALQNRALKREVGRLGAAEKLPAAGMWAPAFATTAVDGRPVVLGKSDAPYQLIYFFSTTCRYCEQSVPAIRQLSTLVDQHAGNAQLIAVSQQDRATTAEYARRHGLAMPIVANPGARVLGLFKAQAVPMLLVVDRRGKVVHSQLGVLAIPFDPEVERTVVAGQGRPQRPPTSP